MQFENLMNKISLITYVIDRIPMLAVEAASFEWHDD